MKICVFADVLSTLWLLSCSGGQWCDCIVNIEEGKKNYNLECCFVLYCTKLSLRHSCAPAHLSKSVGVCVHLHSFAFIWHQENACLFVHKNSQTPEIRLPFHFLAFVFFFSAIVKFFIIRRTNVPNEWIGLLLSRYWTILFLLRSHQT